MAGFYGPRFHPYAYGAPQQGPPPYAGYGYMPRMRVPVPYGARTAGQFPRFRATGPRMRPRAPMAAGGPGPMWGRPDTRLKKTPIFMRKGKANKGNLNKRELICLVHRRATGVPPNAGTILCLSAAFSRVNHEYDEKPDAAGMCTAALKIGDQIFEECRCSAHGRVHARAKACEAAVRHLARILHVIEVDSPTDQAQVVMTADDILSEMRREIQPTVADGNEKVKNMMDKMGWGGGGLGKDEQGISEPITVTEVFNRQGLGSESKDIAEFQKAAEKMLHEYATTESDIGAPDLVFEANLQPEYKKVLTNLCSKMSLKAATSNCGQHLTIGKQVPPKQLLDLVLAMPDGRLGKYKVFPPGSWDVDEILATSVRMKKFAKIESRQLQYASSQMLPPEQVLATVPPSRRTIRRNKLKQQEGGVSRITQKLKMTLSLTKMKNQRVIIQAQLTKRTQKTPKVKIASRSLKSHIPTPQPSVPPPASGTSKNLGSIPSDASATLENSDSQIAQNLDSIQALAAEPTAFKPSAAPWKKQNVQKPGSMQFPKTKAVRPPRPAHAYQSNAESFFNMGGGHYYPAEAYGYPPDGGYYYPGPEYYYPGGEYFYPGAEYQSQGGSYLPSQEQLFMNVGGRPGEKRRGERGGAKVRAMQGGPGGGPKWGPKAPPQWPTAKRFPGPKRPWAPPTAQIPPPSQFDGGNSDGTPEKKRSKRGGRLVKEREANRKLMEDMMGKKNPGFQPKSKVPLKNMIDFRPGDEKVLHGNAVTNDTNEWWLD